VDDDSVLQVVRAKGFDGDAQMDQKSNATSPSAADDILQQFLLQNSKATRLLYTAAQDYASARCLLLNHLLAAGLTMGAQAIEKFLKAYVLLKSPSTDVKAMSHNLQKLLTKADDLSLGLGFSKYPSLMDRFGRHYNNRYPDNAISRDSMSSEELFELDEFVMFINENMPCPPDVRCRTGLFAAAASSLFNGGTVTPWERWIKESNRALHPRLPQIEANFRTSQANLYSNRLG
jgi:hypothetical protein